MFSLTADQLDMEMLRGETSGKEVMRDVKIRIEGISITSDFLRRITVSPSYVLNG